MSLKSLIHRAFQKTGYDFRKYTPENFPALNRRQSIISERIDLVLDVGANEGTYVIDLRDSGFRGRVISFEPLPLSFAILQQRANKDPNWMCINAALGMSDGKGEINVSARKTSSSLLPMENAHLNAVPMSSVISKEEVNVFALDSFLGKIIDPRERIYLKIDVQGYEMFVLQGAMRLLEQIRGIEIELSFVPLYKKAPVFSEMVDFLEKCGFFLVALSHVLSDPKSGRLLQVDGIFIRHQ